MEIHPRMYKLENARVRRVYARGVLCPPEIRAGGGRFKRGRYQMNFVHNLPYGGGGHNFRGTMEQSS